MLTEFGKSLRKIRIDRGELLRDMSEKLGVTASYLSAVEIGKRSIPFDWIDKIINTYNLNNIEVYNLKQAADIATKSIKIDLEGKSRAAKECTFVFARQFDDLGDDVMIQIKELINKRKEGK